MSDKKQPKIRFKGFADDWEQRKWSETVDISTDMVDPKTGEFDNLPHIGPGNIESFSGKLLPNVRTVHDSHLISGKFHFFPGNIIYGKINPQLGKYVLPNFEGLSSADTYVLNAKNGLNQYFLFGLIQTNNFYKYSVSVSMRTGMPKINRDELDQYIFSAPSVEEQKGIGLLLLKIQNIIAANQHKLDELKQLKKLLMQKIFSQEWRFKGFTDPWEQRKLGEISSVRTGPFGSVLHASDYVRDGVPIITTEHFKNGSLPLIKDGVPQVSKLDYSRLHSYVLLPNDIVFSRVGSIDINALVTNAQKGWLFSGRVLRVRPDVILSGAYMHYLLSTSKVRNEVIRRAVGQTMPSISTQILKNTIVRLTLNNKEESSIANMLMNLDSIVAANQQKLTQLKQLKKYLMQNMFV